MTSARADLEAASGKYVRLNRSQRGTIAARTPPRITPRNLRAWTGARKYTARIDSTWALRSSAVPGRQISQELIATARLKPASSITPRKA